MVDNLGTGRLCTPSVLTENEGGNAVRQAPQHVTKKVPFSTLELGVHHAIAIVGSGTFYVRLCWSSNGPVSLNGAYLNARFPNVFVFGSTRDGQGIERHLDLGEPNAADYVIQSLQQPTSVTDGGWQWVPRTALDAVLNFTAVNTSETQHDTYNAFLSGILFGVAGGALVSLVVELVAPFRSRQERRAAEPAG